MTVAAPDSRTLVSPLDRVGRLSLIVGGGALLLSGIAWIVTPRAFYPAYLCAWLFWLAVSMGCLALVMLNHLTGGAWGILVRRFAEAAANMLPLLLVLFIPVLIGTRFLYPWRIGNPEHDNPFVMHRAGYFQFWLWIVRLLIYFAAWIGLAALLKRKSLQHDNDPQPRSLAFMRKLSGPGMVLYFVFMSLAAVDWIMSREPNWRSTMFGFIICMGQATAGLAFLTILLAIFAPNPPFRDRVTADHFNDLGNLLLTCVILWSYLAFSQLLIIWLGNTQGEIVWYVPRTRAGWHVLAAILIIFHFAVPFMLLLMRAIKRNRRIMIWLCAGLLVMRWVDLVWITLPTSEEPNSARQVVTVLLSFLILIGIGGIWTWIFLWQLIRASLLPSGILPTESEHFAPVHNVQDNARTEYDRQSGPEPGGAVA